MPAEQDKGCCGPVISGVRRHSKHRSAMAGTGNRLAALPAAGGTSVFPVKKAAAKAEHTNFQSAERTICLGPIPWPIFTSIGELK